MAVNDEQIMDELQQTYGRDWLLGRTRDHTGSPNWWTAKRKRQLTGHEDSRGLDRTLYGDTADDLRAELDKQAEKQAQIAASDPARL